MEVFALANQGLQVPKREKMDGKLKTDSAKKKRYIRRKWTIALIAAVLLITSVLIYNPFASRTAFTGKEKSIAGLPFTNMSNEKNNEYFSDGMTDEIITQLSKIADLKVISRTTMIQYKHTKKPLKRIAEELGVAAILAGSVQKAGEMVKINAQLVDANTDVSIWAENYSRDIKDVFSIQSEVAQAIANQLKAHLSTDERISINKKLTDNPEAYDLFLKGRYAYYNDMLNAEAFFQEAIKKDPKFTLAHSYLASLYINLTTWAGDLEPSTGASKAMGLLNNSLQKDTLYIDFITLASIEWRVNKNYSKAEYYCKRAINANPNEELSYFIYANLLKILGRTEEALAMLDKAKSVNPVSPWGAGGGRGEIYFASGRYDEAVETFKKSIQLSPNDNNLYDGLGRVYVVTEKYSDAITILNEGLKRSAKKPPSTLAYMAIAYFKMQNTKKSGELIQELKQRANRGEKGINIFIALYYSAVNNKEEAFNFLDWAFATNDVDLIWLKQEPSFVNLRHDPRYNTYLKRAGF